MITKGPIPRARFSHSVVDDIRSFIATIFIRRGTSSIKKAESEFANYVGRKGCVSFSLARTSLYYSLKSLGAKSGDTILLPPITIKAMLDVSLDLGLNPVFVDLDPKTACFDVDKLQHELRKTKIDFCLLTYLFGICPDLEQIVKILDSSGVNVIEDFSQGLNLESNMYKSGRVGKISIYSASAIKTLDTYGGGFALSDDEEVLRSLRTFQGQLPMPNRSTILKKIIISFIKNLLARPPIFSLMTFWIIRSFSLLGRDNLDRFVGSRGKSPLKTLPAEWFRSFTAPQATFLLRYLKRVKRSDAARRRHALHVIDGLGSHPLISGSGSYYSVFWQLIVISELPQKLRSYLQKNRIDSAFTSLILLSDLPDYGISVDTPIAKLIYNNGVYLPCFADLTEKESERIVKTLREFIQRYGVL